MSAMAHGDLSFEREAVANEFSFPAASDGDDLRLGLTMLRDTIFVMGCMVYLRAMLLMRSWNY